MKNVSLNANIVTDNTFTMILPNKNLKSQNNEEDILHITHQQQRIIDYIKEHEYITYPIIQELLDVKKTRAYVIVKSLKDKNIVKCQGRGDYNKIYFNQEYSKTRVH